MMISKYNLNQPCHFFPSIEDMCNYILNPGLIRKVFLFPANFYYFWHQIKHNWF